MNKSKAMRQIEQHAKKGDVTAMFQLYDNYKSGTDVSADKKKSDEFLEQCINFLESHDEHGNAKNQLELKKIQLIYFRKFKSLTIDFEKKLTVIIGNNGSGKTTIVESIAKVLGWISAGIETEGKNFKRIDYSDINNDCPHYADVNASFSFGNNTSFKGGLSRAIKGAEEKRDSSVFELKSLANIFRSVNSNRPINLPIFAYYSVARASDKSKNTFDVEMTSESKIDSRIEAYSGALDGDGRLSDFVEWFLFLDNLSNSENDSKSAEQLKVDIVDLEVALELSDSKVKSVIESILKSKRQDYEKVTTRLKPTNDIHNRQYKSVVSAITSFVPSLTEIKVDRSSGRAEVKVNNEGVWVNINQLSQGQRVMVGLVADLSRRMVKLNPNLSNPLRGRGIVLIDEIELHLHPKWQQQIILSLLSLFPNVQFILTTHSPHVLSTVDKQSIRSLLEDGSVITPEFQTKGVVSSDVLEQLMHTFSIPPVPEAEWFNDFTGYVEQGLQDDPKAKILYVKLVEHFGEQHPVTVQCNSMIKLQELKNKARAKLS